MTAPFCPQYFIRAFKISTLPIASPGVSLHFAGCSLRSCAGWRAHGGSCSLRGACMEPAGLWPRASVGQRVSSEGSSDTSRRALSRSVCLLCRLPNKSCSTAKAGWPGESSWAAPIPESTGSLSRASRLTLLSLRSNNFQIYSFLAEHLSKWV